MKRYISAILIPCLLMQLFGCYSSEEISLDELQNLDEAIITTKENVEYHLKRNISKQEVINDPDFTFANNWVINTNAEIITLITQKPYLRDGGGDLWQIRVDTTKINYNNISSVSITSLRIGDTLLIVGLTVAGIAGLALLIASANMGR